MGSHKAVTKKETKQKRDLSYIEKEGLDSEEAAYFIGISESYLWDLRFDPTSGLPYRKIGNRTLFPRTQLTLWLHRGVVTTPEGENALHDQRRKENRK
jgi:hypothetical protein